MIVAIYMIRRSRILLFAFALCVLQRTAVAQEVSAPPYSLDALTYLIDRSEYDRFDWYIERYLRSHPDSAALHVVKAQRWFHEAERTTRRMSAARSDRTGGIPRRYPEYILNKRPRQLSYAYVHYDDRMIQNAFDAMRRALELAPDKRPVWESMCRMAARAGRPDILREQLGWGAERYGIDSLAARAVVDMASREQAPAHDSAVAQLLRYMAHEAPSAAVLTELARFHVHLGEHGLAAAYLADAASADSSDIRVVRLALDIAAARGDFSAAARFAARAGSVSGSPRDNAMARVFRDAAVITPSRAGAVVADCAADSVQCVYDNFRERLRLYIAKTPVLYDSTLFALNFVLVASAKRVSGDEHPFYLHKAGLFYICAMYDSAAFYNLQLLRWGQFHSGLEFSAAFNLAAEYFASGNYMMAYQRFLDLFRYARAAGDPGVRYGLAITCETHGDRPQAVWHYQAVARSRKYPDERYYPLRSLARQRLTGLKGVTPRAEFLY